MKEKLSNLFRRKPLFDYLLYALILFGTVALDQLTKWLAVKYLMPIDTVPIIEGVIHLTYLENRGAAFGMLADAPWVFNTFSVIAILAILLYLFLGHAETRLYAVPLAMIAGGGIGNMIDRTMLGYVVDFIDFRLINFAVFNGADSFVCVGAALLILVLVLDIIKETKREAATTTTTIDTAHSADADNATATTTDTTTIADNTTATTTDTTTVADNATATTTDTTTVADNATTEDKHTDGGDEQ